MDLRVVSKLNDFFLSACRAKEVCSLQMYVDYFDSAVCMLDLLGLLSPDDVLFLNRAICVVSGLVV